MTKKEKDVYRLGRGKIGRRVVYSTIEVEAIGLGEVWKMVVFLQEIWREMSQVEVMIV